MNAREQRGLTIAALCRLNRVDNVWVVPSQQGGDKKYLVDPKHETCTCPDFQETGGVCKHLYAVRFTMKRETADDGTVTETRSLTFTETKVYTQNWPKYNAAQATEKRRVQVLLNDLCRDLPERDCTHRRGPKPHSVKDSVFSMVFKVYCGLSSRRFSCDLQEAHERGHLSRPIPGMKVNSFFENPEFTPLLKDLIAKSAAPLAAVETSFAVDSSGFSSSRHERWYDERYGVTKSKCVWVKAHVACGTKTGIVTAVRILNKDSADHPQFRPLVEQTAATFTVKEVSADKAYTSNENFEAVADVGGTAYLAFKSNATGTCGGLFEKMLRYFKFEAETYLAHYHKRSNIEAVFSAVKRRFGDAVMSKTDVAMANEVLCKLLAHNLCCLIQEQEELGIVPVFFKDEETVGMA
jgi:transposase